MQGLRGLEKRSIAYSVESVMVDGANVVSQAQQRVTPGAGRPLTLDLFLHTVRFTARDVLFGTPAGSGIYLTYPDGRTERFTLEREGELVIENMAPRTLPG